MYNVRQSATENNILVLITSGRAIISILHARKSKNGKIKSH